MSPIPEARAGKVEESEAKDILMASKFPFAEKIIDYLYGGIPVETNTAVNEDNTVSVKVEKFPFFTTEDERPFAQGKAEYKIRQKSSDDVYTLSLLVGENPASLVSRTDILIDNDAMDSIKKFEEGDHCGVVDLQSKMLMALFADTGDFVYFTAGLREKKKQRPIRKMLESGIKPRLPEHKEKAPEKPEALSEEPAAELYHEKGTDDIEYRPSKEFLSEKLKTREIASILGIKEGTVNVNISRGYIEGRTRYHIAKRISSKGRKTEEEKLAMYNELFKGQGITFEHINQVYALMPDLKKKLD